MKVNKKEYQEIRVCEFAMHLLIPTEDFLQICDGVNNLRDMDIYHNYAIVKKLAKQFYVSEDVMIFKLSYLLYKEEKDEDGYMIYGHFQQRDEILYPSGLFISRHSQKRR